MALSTPALLFRTTCPWRLPPRDFPKRSTVQRYIYAWQAKGLLEKVNFLLVQQARERDSRKASVGSGVSRLRPRKAAVREGMTPARRSTGANATSLPIPAVIWLAHRCTQPTSRIETAHPTCWLRSLPLPMAAPCPRLREGRLLPMVPTRGQQAGDSACRARQWALVKRSDQAQGF